MPSLASLSASSFPKMLECPFIHSKEVLPVLLHRALTRGLIRLAWAEVAKVVLVRFLRSSHRVLMVHCDSVLMWRWLELGVREGAL